MSLAIPIISTFDSAGIRDAKKAFSQLETNGQKAAFAVRKAAVPAGLALAALGGFMVKAAKGAEEARIATAALDNVLGSMGFADATDRVSAYAESLEKTIAVDADVIKRTQTKLATFSELTKTVNEAGGSFDRATKAALDMASAGFGTAEGNAVQLGKALQDPIKGIAALAKSGVTFTEQEKDKIKVLVESGQQLKAQEMILKAIELQVGGTAEASASSFDKMKFAIAGVSDTFGDMLLPVIDALAPKLAAFSLWATENPALLKVVALSIAGITTAVVALNLALAANPFTLAAVALAALIAGVVYAYGRFETFRTVVNNVINGLALGFEFMANGFIRAINTIIRAINIVKPGSDIATLSHISLGRLGGPDFSGDMEVQRARGMASFNAPSIVPAASVPPAVAAAPRVSASASEPPLTPYTNIGATGTGLMESGVPNIAINIDAGLISNPISIGQDIIDAILAAQRANGTVFAAA